MVDLWFHSRQSQKGQGEMRIFFPTPSLAHVGLQKQTCFTKCSANWNPSISLWNLNLWLTYIKRWFLSFHSFDVSVLFINTNVQTGCYKHGVWESLYSYNQDILFSSIRTVIFSTRSCSPSWLRALLTFCSALRKIVPHTTTSSSWPTTRRQKTASTGWPLGAKLVLQRFAAYWTSPRRKMACMVALHQLRHNSRCCWNTAT